MPWTRQKPQEAYGNQDHVPINQLGITWHGLCNRSVSMEGVTNMTQKLVDDDFIGPIKPQMSMTYRDFLMMINTGLGLLDTQLQVYQ